MSAGAGGVVFGIVGSFDRVGFSGSTGPGARSAFQRERQLQRPERSIHDARDATRESISWLFFSRSLPLGPCSSTPACTLDLGHVGENSCGKFCSLRDINWEMHWRVTVYPWSRCGCAGELQHDTLPVALVLVKSGFAVSVRGGRGYGTAGSQPSRKVLLSNCAASSAVKSFVWGSRSPR